MELSNGSQVRVGPLKWKAYKALKDRVMQVLADQVGKLSDDMGAKEFVASIGGSLPAIFDSLNEEFIRGCLDKPGVLDAEDLNVSDIDALYAEALSVNPISKILEREKNSPAGELARRIIENLPQFGTPSVSTGGLPSSPSVYDPGGDDAS